MTTTRSPASEPIPAARQRADVMMLLAELGRVLKGRSYYGPGHANLARIFERTLQVWQQDLRQHGPLEIAVGSDGLRVPELGAEGELTGQFTGLTRALAVRAAHALRVEPEIDAEAFAALIEILVTDPGRLAAEGGAPRALARRAPFAVALRGPEPPAPAVEETRTTLPLPAPPPPRVSAEALPSDEPSFELPRDELLLAPQRFDEDSSALLSSASAPVEFPSDEPGELAAGELEELAAAEPDGISDAEPLELEDGALAPASEDFELEGEALALDDEAGLELDLDERGALFETDLAAAETAEAAAADATTHAESAAHSEYESEISLDVASFDTDDEAPSHAASSASPAARRPAPAWEPGSEPSAFVREILADLEECSEDEEPYRELVDRAYKAGESLVEQGLEGDAFPIVSTLAEHVGDDQKRPLEQRNMAQRHLARLVRGSCLEDLLERATSADATSLRATQILNLLGSEVAGAVLRAAEAERGAERRERLHGILISMGEESLPELLRVLSSGTASRVRNAIRLVGDLQHPGAVQRLAELLEGDNTALSQEAARSLVRIGDESSSEALVGALASPREPVATIAVHALASTRSARAVTPLLRAMNDAIEAGRIDFARETIRALGRLGRSEATPVLAGLLLRRGMFQPRRHRELKLAAASALGRLPGDEAVGALAQAAQSRDTHIRRAAQIALDRRAQVLAED